TGAGGTRIASGGGSAPPSPNQGVSNFGGGGSYPTTGTTTPAAPTAPNTAGNGYSSYIAGGSSPFGLIDSGGGNTLNMFDSSGLYANGVMPAYGSMPDYSNPNSWQNN